MGHASRAFQWRSPIPNRRPSKPPAAQGTRRNPKARSDWEERPRVRKPKPLECKLRMCALQGPASLFDLPFFLSFLEKDFGLVASAGCDPDARTPLQLLHFSSPPCTRTPLPPTYGFETRVFLCGKGETWLQVVAVGAIIIQLLQLRCYNVVQMVEHLGDASVAAGSGSTMPSSAATHSARHERKGSPISVYSYASSLTIPFAFV